MPLLSLNASGADLQALNGGDPMQALARAARALRPGQPAVIMIHGFRFSPTVPRRSPHGHILAAAPIRKHWKALSWPRNLGLAGGEAPSCGLAIGLGWEARGTIWQARARAATAAGALARLVEGLRRVHPGPVTLIAHSMGARVALAALPQIGHPSGIDRLVLLGAAAFRDEADAALASPAGRGTEIVNVTSRENDLFDFLLEGLFLRRPRSTLGQGGPDAPNWLDIQLDHAPTLRALAAMGYPVPPPSSRVCHWSLYLRPGIFALYRDLLVGRETLPLSRLRAQLDAAPQPRWTRLWAGLPDTQQDNMALRS